ncbi:MAG TPA: cytochrome c [Candidatus Angelobacter sp.]
MRKGKIIGILIVVVVIAVAVYSIVVVRRGFSARDNPSWLESTMAGAARSMAYPSSAKQMQSPLPATNENLMAGEAHWADHCALCHANNGSGDTVIGKNLYPKAPDMRKSGTQNMTDGELYYTIQNGVRLTGMPAWGSAGDDDEDTWKLVQFIRHLPELTAEEEKHMESLNPKTPEEIQEERQEQEFLNGQSEPLKNSQPMKH